MKKTSLLITLAAFCLIFSCTKINEDFDTSGIEMNSMEYNPEEEAVCLNCEIVAERNESSGEIETVLGRQITNPYSLEIMTQAYNNIYHQNVSLLEPTHKYIRVRPTDDEQLDQLEGEEDLVLSDYPLNYVVEVEGDYYPSVELAAGEEPWFYTVVPIEYQIPEGIEYELLEDVIVPDFNEPLEDEAYYLAGEMDDEELATYARVRTDIVDGDLLSPPCDIINMWSEENCTGYAGGGNGGSGYYPPNTNPQVPQGKFSTKMYVSNPNGTILSDLEPVRSVRIIGRRFLKHDRTYTDNTGNFKFSKRFPGKVHVFLKFHSPYYSNGRFKISDGINAVRSVKLDIGVFKGNLSNMPNYVFSKGGSSESNSTKYWVSSIINNDFYKFKNYCNQNNLVLIDDNIHIGVKQEKINGDPSNIDTDPFLSGHSVMMHVNAGIWKNDDISIRLGKFNLQSLTPSRISECIYFHLTSLNLFTAPTWGEYSFLSGNGLTDPQHSTYPIFQAYKMHLANMIVDNIYGLSASTFSRQNKTWTSNFVSSNMQYLEQFDPTITSDPYFWIPQGLILDLIDTNNESTNGVFDNVSGFTLLEIRSAIQGLPDGDWDTMAEFKQNLKNIKPSQSTQIDQILSSYGY